MLARFARSGPQSHPSKKILDPPMQILIDTYGSTADARAHLLSGQRQCCDPRRIDADLFASASGHLPGRPRVSNQLQYASRGKNTQA